MVNFKRWYEQKAEDLMNNANSMQESITNLQGEIEAVGQQMAEYQRQLDDLALQIQALNESIAQIEANMAVLQEEIEMKEKRLRCVMLDQRGYGSYAVLCRC